MSDAELRELVAAQRGDLVTMLDGLTGAQWDAPTLCAGWRVREVIAHITMQYRYRPARFFLELAKSGGRFNRMSDRRARADGAVLSPAELTGTLRANVHHPWKPPGGGYAGALSHDVIHGLDITVALGIDERVADDRMRVVLGALNARGLRYFGVDLNGIQLRADDLDWSFGSGEPLSGAARDLLLVACGRLLPEGRLRGAASARFTGSR